MPEFLIASLLFAWQFLPVLVVAWAVVEILRLRRRVTALRERVATLEGPRQRVSRS